MHDDRTLEQILDDLGGTEFPRKKRSMYRQTPCHQYLVRGMHAFDIVPKAGAFGPTVTPGVPLVGSITLAGYTGDPPCDIYEYDDKGEGWVLVAFDAEVGKGAEIVKRVFLSEEISVSIATLGGDAYVKFSGAEHPSMFPPLPRWAHIVNGKVTILTEGEAVAHGLEKLKVETVQLVIGDEPAIAEYLVENGVAEPGVTVVESASIEDVRGINVAGDVPVHIAAHARSVTSVLMADVPRRYEGWGKEKNPKKLTLKQVRKNVLEVRRYSVERS